MVDVRGYTPGLFNWIELATTDKEGAIKFYSALIGWETVEHPAAPGGAYLLFQHNKRTVGGLYQLSDAKIKSGQSPNWLSYISVESADESAKKVQELGGKLLSQPFDVQGDRRVVIASDPTGAMFAMWQPTKRHGAEVVQEPGSVSRHELVTTDAGAASTFYSSLFGWQANTQDLGGGASYTSFMSGQFDACGMEVRPEYAGKVNPHWKINLQVADCDLAAKKASELGGQFRVPPTDIPGLGRLSWIRDPYGAECTIIAFAS